MFYYVRGIDFAYDFSIRFWNCSDSVGNFFSSFYAYQIVFYKKIYASNILKKGICFTFSKAQ